MAGSCDGNHYTRSFEFALTTTLKLLEDQSRFETSSVGKQKKAAKKGRGKRRGGCRPHSKHSPYDVDPTVVSEEAFAQARQRAPLGFWVALVTILAGRFQKEHPQGLRYRRFRLLALDGTTLKLPNAARLREHYGRPKNSSRRKASPQARMAMMILPGTRIPIAYEVSPLATSELTLARRFLPHIQANDLVLMDRGFISYGFFWDLQNRGAFFGTRLKKNLNLNLKKARQLGTKDWLVKWTPKDSRGQWTQLPRSIKPRLIEYQLPGFRASAIVTNVLDRKRSPRADWVRLARQCDDNGKFTPGLYHRRWEIESSYYELKVVLHTKSLRSHTPASIEYELAGRVLYYLLIRWLIVEAAKKKRIDPLRISFTNAVCELEHMRTSLVINDPKWGAKVLLPRLLERIASHLVPLRPGRHYPRPNDTKTKDRGNGQKQKSAKISSRVNSNHSSKK